MGDVRNDHLLATELVVDIVAQAGEFTNAVGRGLRGRIAVDNLEL